MRLIDGDALVMLLTDWWYASFGQTETQESKAIKAVLDQVKIHVEKHGCKPCEVGTQMSLSLCKDAVSREAVLDALRTCYDTEAITYDNGEEYIHYGDAVGEVEQLPSVTPTKLISKISIEDEILNGIATKAAPNVSAMPPVYAVSADDVIENMESELELCNRVLDDLDIVGTEHEIHSRIAEILREQIDFVKGLPQVEPEPRTGKWIKNDVGMVVCSECGGFRRDNRANYIGWCNKCGAKMEEQNATI